MDIKRIPPSIDRQTSEKATGAGDKIQLQNKTEGARTDEPVKVADRLQVSADYRQIGLLKRSAMDLPDLRSEYVDSIRRMVEAGTYIVRSHEIVKKLIEETI
jgi:anti-sigma28 factor (negative regulator of flagellin synthesis)